MRGANGNGRSEVSGGMSHSNKSGNSVKVKYILRYTDRLSVHMKMWGQIILVMTPTCAVIGYLAYSNLLVLSVVVTGYFWMTGKFYLGVAAMLLQRRVPVTLRLERERIDIWMGGDTRIYGWSDVAELQKQRRLSVLWFHDGGVLPVPREVLSQEVLRSYLEPNVSDA